MLKNKLKLRPLILLFLLLQLSGQSYADELKQRIILLGDAGYSKLSPLEPSLQLAADIAKEEPNKTKVLFLGDNIYTRGYPVLKGGKTDFNKKQLKQISYLTAQLQVAKISGSQLYLLPGNHDWIARQVDDQANYIKSYAQSEQLNAALVPYQQGKKPLPEIVHLPGISLLFIDSTWWLRKSGKNIAKVNKHIEKLLAQQNKNYPDNIIMVASHHPVKSVGPHGSLGKVAECIEDKNCNHKKVGEIAHPVSQKAIKSLTKILASYEKVIYAAGHDHSLQVFEFEGFSSENNKNSKHIALVSGSANRNKLSPVGKTTDNIFALSEMGFMVLDIYQQSSELKVYTVKKGEVVFEKMLFKGSF